MKREITQGNWKAVPHDTLNGYTIISDEKTVDDMSKIIGHTVHAIDSTKKETKANSILFAASPGLLRTLEAIKLEAEMVAANISYDCGLGVSEFESFLDRLSPAEKKILKLANRALEVISENMEKGQ